MPLLSLTVWNFVAEVQFYTKNGRFAFWAPLWGMGLGATYGVRLRLIGKRVGDFLLVLTELFSLGVTVEALRAKIDWNRHYERGGSVCAKFSRRRGHPPPIIYTLIDRPMNAHNYVADSFHTNKRCSRLSQAKCDTRKTAFCGFEPPLGALGQRTMFLLYIIYIIYYIRLIRKCVVDFLLMLIELFC